MNQILNHVARRNFVKRHQTHRLLIKFKESSPKLLLSGTPPVLLAGIQPQYNVAYREKRHKAFHTLKTTSRARRNRSLTLGISRFVSKADFL